MPQTTLFPVKQLSLDLSNFRTVRQPDELHAIQSLISIHPEYFWALMESLIDDGYLPTENILVLRASENDSESIVMEGNRRIAALKLAHGYVSSANIDFPDNIRKKLDRLSAVWKRTNENVPCTIYAHEEKLVVARIIALAHGKGEKAGRDPWNAVARARHSRDANNSPQSALDLLEKYLKEGRNVTPLQAERWAGDYPLTVLEEAMKKIAPRLGVSGAPALAKKYPSISYREALESLVNAIGLKLIDFPAIRDKTRDFAEKYGVPPARSSSKASSSAEPNANADSTSSKTANASNNDTSNATTNGDSSSSHTSPAEQSTESQAGQEAPDARKPRGTRAVSIRDPRAVKRLLKTLQPTGNNREKVVMLRNEAIKLNLAETPLAFCFVLRSMFEISAKAYCEDHKSNGGPSYKRPNGQDKSLENLLSEIVNHLTKGKTDNSMTRLLHGPITELGRPDGILSVTSMNQLVHNPRFAITAGDISTMFGNIFPLLEAMNDGLCS